MRRQKPKTQIRDKLVMIRLSKSEKRALEKGALAAGLPLSSWLRMLGLREAGHAVR